MTESDLRDACVTREISDIGNRKTLLDRLRGDSAFTLELLSVSADRSTDGYKTISETLAAVAKTDGGSMLREILQDVKEVSERKNKNVDVTITSIGMAPNKFTAGGAPSVTADVLRGLAGDPLGDDPKYGSRIHISEVVKQDTTHAWLSTASPQSDQSTP